MRPIDQTTFGVPEGNCFAACLASLLEIPLEEVPDLTHETDSSWWGVVEKWLRLRGLYAVNFVCRGKDLDTFVPPGLHILNGPSPRGAFDHSVVARGREIVHDPHPSRAGLAGYRDRMMLVPMDPARHT